MFDWGAKISNLVKSTIFFTTTNHLFLDRHSNRWFFYTHTHTPFHTLMEILKINLQIFFSKLKIGNNKKPTLKIEMSWIMVPLEFGCSSEVDSIRKHLTIWIVYRLLFSNICLALVWDKKGCGWFFLLFMLKQNESKMFSCDTIFDLVCKQSIDYLQSNW